VLCCVLRVACCVLRVACCVLRVACCVLRAGGARVRWYLNTYIVAGVEAGGNEKVESGTIGTKQFPIRRHNGQRNSPFSNTIKSSPYSKYKIQRKSENPSRINIIYK
jgi:hypothetical protein